MPVVRSILLSAFILLPLDAQEVNLNEYYRYPLALGVSYQQLSGFGNRALLDFRINEIGGELRVPIRSNPTIQPAIRGGVMIYEHLSEGSGESVGDQDWTHQHVFLAPAIGFRHRLSRDFEVGAELFGGVTQSVFSNLQSQIHEQGEDYGQLNALGGGGVSIALNPSYNFNFAVAPSVRYLQGLGPLDSYDGFTFGVGFHLNYRFGRDPDAATAPIRALRFGDIEIPDVFAAMRSVYSQQPITSFTIQNTESFPITDVTLEFFQEGFMDSPTMIASIDELSQGETREINLTATFSEQIFSTQGVTPLNGEITAYYTARGRSAEQRRSVSYDLHDRNALTWDNDQKVAAFITPSDSAVRNYASFIRRIHREDENGFLSKNLQFAIQVYNSLVELGIIYQIDPTSPFSEVQENTFAVDSISFPRETLTRLSGDCDDLTVLYNTILQSAGVETGFITTPGHIYSVINTEVAARDYEEVHGDREMLLEIGGEIWVPIEITLLGRGGFIEAWTTGITEYRQYDDSPEQRGFYLTGEAHETYRPVALREVDLGLQYGDAEKITERFSNDIDSLARVALGPVLRRTQERDDPRSWNRYGIAAAQFGAYGEATSGFERAQELDPSYLNPQINLGSLHYLRKDYDAALSTFANAVALLDTAERVRDSERFKVFLNLSRTHYSLENYEQAREYFDRAAQIDRRGVERYSFLGSTVGGDGVGRASEAAGVAPILFMEE